MIKLSKISTDPPKSAEKDAVEKQTEKLVERLGELQKLVMANRKHAVLVVFQGMDGSGKDGAVENVFSKCTASGISVTGFKKPSDEEFAHDFLWRVHKVVPEKGQFRVFVRSHYEDILIQSVHGWIDAERVKKRMAAINAFEELLVFDNSTIVLKFMLHISPEEQAEQLQQRIDDPEKHWKHNAADWEEHKLWSQYMAAYEFALNNSSIPWTVVPVDKRWWRDFVIASKIVEELEKLNMTWPDLPKEKA